MEKSDLEIVRDALQTIRTALDVAFPRGCSADDAVDVIAKYIDRLSKQCPKGENCDMTLAYMVGRAAAKTVDVELLKTELRHAVYGSRIPGYKGKSMPIGAEQGVEFAADYLISKGLLNGSNTAGKDGE